jgi:hypothetical protein
MSIFISYHFTLNLTISFICVISCIYYLLSIGLGSVLRESKVSKALVLEKREKEKESEGIGLAWICPIGGANGRT